jgi:hypothetical protein
VTKSQVAKKTRVSLLRRLAIVFADPLRLKIITELYMRAMSPTEFFNAFGGGSVPRVNRHFKTLAKHGWLTLVTTKTGGRRRGATENFYRASKLAIFDLDAWSRLPYSIRVAFSWRIFEQFSERFKEAVVAGTFDARPERHFSWTPIHVDRHGWKTVIAAIDALFETVLQEQADAKLRIARSNETPILATVALAGFESPSALKAVAQRENPILTLSGVDYAKSLDSPMPLPVRLSKVFADELSLRVLTELNLREMSPKEFYVELGGDSLSEVSRRFKQLTTTGWLKLVRTETGGRRRGAIEHFYRATGPAVFDTQDWSEVSESTKTTFSWTIFEQLDEQFKNAVAAGTLDARPERHLTWSLLMLDELGWERAIAAVEKLFALIFEEQEKAQDRIGKSGEETVRMTVAMAAFESPKDTTKAP